MADDAYDVVVAGLGAMGGAAAWRLARRGLRVLGLDRFRPPHAFGSTHGGSRVIRETSFEHPRYVPLARQAWPLWEDLAAASRRRLFVPAGALYLGRPGAAVVEQTRRSAREHDVPIEEVDAGAIARRWPAVRCPDGAAGVFEPRAGILRPEACVTALHEVAAAAGAVLAYDEPMATWEPDGAGVIVRTGARTVRAGGLVLATGPWMQAELAALGVAVWIERVVQHWFRPAFQAGQLRPGACPVYLWEDEAGVVFYGFPWLEGATKCAIHHRGRSTTPDGVDRAVTDAEIEATWRKLGQLLPGAAGDHRRSAVCVYTNTPDGDFIVDRHPRHPQVVLLSPCSGIGFKFAPRIGEMAAMLAAGEPVPEAEAFGVGRLTGGT